MEVGDICMALERGVEELKLVSCYGSVGEGRRGTRGDAHEVTLAT